jgi:hypothetical protein
MAVDEIFRLRLGEGDELAEGLEWDCGPAFST